MDQLAKLIQCSETLLKVLHIIKGIIFTRREVIDLFCLVLIKPEPRDLGLEKQTGLAAEPSLKNRDLKPSMTSHICYPST